MKRLYISYILLLLSSIICFTQFIGIYISCEAFSDEINTIEEYYRNEDYKSALSLCNKASSQWRDREKYTKIFINQEDVDSIGDNLETLGIYITARNDARVLSLCCEIENQLDTLKKKEMPRLENIL